MKTITTIVMIGKSKKEVSYTFKYEDFLRIEGDKLFLKHDDRKLTIATDFVIATIELLND